MQLSDELFASISGCLNASIDPADRRKATRTGACAGVTVYGHAHGELSTPMPVGLRDLSPGGLCILQYQALAPGRQFVAEFSTLGGQTVRILCTIRYCRAVNDELYAMGAAFTAFWQVQPDSAAA